MSADTMRLVVPSMDYVESYTVALERGWNPGGLCDRKRLLATLKLDPEQHVAMLARWDELLPGGGGQVEYRSWWMWDGGFCGCINFSYQPGELMPPPGLDGHVELYVVPWLQRQGYASRALRLALPLMADAGMEVVYVGCPNKAIERVAEKNGGIAVRTLRPTPQRQFALGTMGSLVSRVA